MDYGKVSYLRFVFPFVIGILIAVFLPYPIELASYGFVFGSFFLLLIYRRRWFYSNSNRWWIFGIALYAVLFLAGSTLIHIHQDFDDENHFSKVDADEFVVTITNDPVVGEKSIKLKADVLGALQQDSIYACKGRLNLYLQKSLLANQLNYGDVLFLKTSPKLLEAPKNPSEFDFKRYMSFHRVYHQLYLDSTQIHKIENLNEGYALFKFSYALKHNLLAVFDAYGMNEKVKAVTSALMIGSKELLDDETIKAYSSAGATHVLAVSGLHVGVIFLIVNWLLRFLDFKKQLKFVKLAVMLLLLWGYALLTGLSPSVIRAATMLSFVAVGGAFGKRSFIFNTVAVSAFFLLLYNPFLIMEVGFQLSYMAVIGIITLQPGISNLLSFDNSFMTNVWSIISVSIAAQIGTAPLGLLYFHQFPVYFLISNLFVIPAASIVIYSGLVFVFFHGLAIISSLSVLKGLALFFYTLLNTAVSLLNAFVVFVESSPNALIEGITISVFETYWIYAILIGLFLFFITVRWRYFYLSLSILIALIFYDSFLNYKAKSSNYILMYSVKNTTAIELKRGMDAILVADSTLLNNEDKMLFHIYHNWWEERIKHCERIPLFHEVFENKYAHIKSNSLWFLENKILVVDDSEKILHTTVSPDFVLIEDWSFTRYEAQQIDSFAIKNRFESATILLGTKLKPKNKRFCKQFFNAIGLKYSDLSKGSYRFTIS